MLALPTDDDTTDEPDGTVTVTLQAADAAYMISGTAAAVVNVTDDDVPEISIVAVGDTITEGAVARFEVTSSLALTQPLIVSVGVVDSGTFLIATAPTTVTVPAGGADVSVTFALPTDDDTTDESDGTVTVTLQAADAAYTISATAGQAVVNVADNDVPGLTITAVAATITEGVEARFEVTSSLALTQPLIVSVGVVDSGTFLTATAPTTVTVPAGGADVSVVLALPTDDDTTDEPDGTVTVTLQADAAYTISGTAVAVVNVTDDDVPEISIVAVGDTITEGAEAQFEVTSSLALTQPLIVSVGVVDSGTFLTATAPTTVTVPVGNADVSVVLVLPTEDDTTDEPDGMVTATLQADAAYTLSTTAGEAVVNVADDDVPGLTITAVGDTITEGEDAQFRVTSSLALAQPLAVSVQVEDSGTFLTATAPTTVTVPAGGADVSVVLALPTDDDTTDEPDGTVTVTLQADAAYTISGTAAAVVNVTDDDVPEISIVAVGDTITEGAEAQFRVTSSLALTQPLIVSVEVEDSGTFLTAPAPTTVTVPVGNANVPVVLALPTEDDTTDEPDGMVTVTLQAADAAYTISGTGQGRRW